MCLIVHVPADATLPRWIIDSAMKCNPDGVGIMHGLPDGTQTVRKWLNIRPHKLERKLNRLRGVEYAVHFRWATHGRIGAANVHPFPVLGNAWLMHNGVLSKYRPDDRNGDISDTRIFIRDYLNPLIALDPGALPVAELCKEISGSAILLMLNDGSMHRYGTGWNEYAGLWLSNEYAWDSPNSYKLGWDITEDLLGSNFGYKPGDYMRKYNANYAQLPAQTYGNSYGGIASCSSDTDADTCDDLILMDLQTCSDDLDLSDDSCIDTEDCAAYAELLGGTLDLAEFLHNITAPTRLALYCQLARKGKV